MLPSERQEIKTVTIHIDEYRELVAASERLTIIRAAALSDEFDFERFSQETQTTILHALDIYSHVAERIRKNHINRHISLDAE